MPAGTSTHLVTLCSTFDCSASRQPLLPEKGVAQRTGTEVEGPQHAAQRAPVPGAGRDAEADGDVENGLDEILGDDDGVEAIAGADGGRDGDADDAGGGEGGEGGGSGEDGGEAHVGEAGSLSWVWGGWSWWILKAEGNWAELAVGWKWIDG
jgi:hypothetical protein